MNLYYSRIYRKLDSLITTIWGSHTARLSNFDGILTNKRNHELLRFCKQSKNGY